VRSIPFGMSSPQGAVAPGRADPIARPGVSTTDLMLLFMSIIWGVNFSVVKYGTTQLPAIAFNGIRMTIAVLTLVLLMRMRGGLGMAWRDARSLFVLGLFGNGLYQIMFIVNLQPVMALLVAGAALGEIPTAAQWGGTGAIIAGVVLTRS